MTDKLYPVLLESPHGGREIPKEVKSWIHISEVDLLMDSDQGVNKIFGGAPCQEKLINPFWRAILNLNRNIDDTSSDGIIKSHTGQGVQIYKSEQGLPEETKNELIEKYAKPYCDAFLRHLINPEIKAVLCAHTMDPVRPKYSKFSSDQANTKELRPLFTLINRGDRLGNPGENSHFSKQGMEHVADIIKNSLQNLNLEVGLFDTENIISFNYPFGGFDPLERVGGIAQMNHKKPICFLEVNHSLLVDERNVIECQNIIRKIVIALADNT